ncbi:diaminopimelate decarboxylase [Parafrankia irregularis]|uniref:Diaminopimelate decarboxylase n=1 Tax=Parafrankia irregularis TaxID=795642 RepID=A0A0S4QYF4_9ACTN|nr:MULTISPECIES: diaminopimelate decarboxylase [Parafrankia]MBE3204900.1 diaminopimelate decarboxylase [Parafrankia sp. CH37]CUU60673.1 diaminopimelate decarboxylase [Parafrankia irregularis]
MDEFSFRDGTLWCEQTPLREVAEKFGTPTYVYSASTLVDHYVRFAKAFESIDPLICFSAKALSNVHLLRLLGDQGAGIDTVSGGELHRALLAGVDPERIVLAGVGKSADELREAVRRDIRCINVESEEEVALLARIAREEGGRPRLAIRVNPDIAPDLRTPARTTTAVRGVKFGVDIERAAALFSRAAGDGFLRPEGIHVHIGSPIFDPQVYAMAIERVLALVADIEAAGNPVTTINLGGGFPAEYTEGSAPGWDEFADAICPRLEGFVHRGGQIIFEPGRTIAANAGVLLAAVRYRKQAGERELVVIDAGMTHIARAAMYDSYHFMWPVSPVNGAIPSSRDQESVDDLVAYDVVGPICESSDYLAKGRALPAMVAGDLVAIFTAGAYGMTMTSNYNSQLRPAEVLIQGADVKLVRRRETYDDLVALEFPDDTPPSLPS